MSPPQPPTPVKGISRPLFKPENMPTTDPQDHLPQWANKVSNKLKPAPSSAAGAIQPCFFAHMCTMGGHMWAQVCPSVHHILHYFCKASLITFIIYSSSKTLLLGKLNTGEIIFIRSISTQLKKSYYYSWHYTRVEFITIWANNGLAELEKNQPPLHFYQVLIYTWGGEENKHSGILNQLVQKAVYHVNKVTCTNRRDTPGKLTKAIKSHRSFGKHVLTHKQRQSSMGFGTKRDCGPQWMSFTIGLSQTLAW